MSRTFNNAASPQIATKGELLVRLRARETPAQQLHLTPNGTVATQVKSEMSRENETRIKSLMTSLKGSAQKLNRAAITSGLRKSKGAGAEP